MTQTLTVPAEAAGERLDRFLAAHVGSRAAAERTVEQGVTVDGVIRPKSFRLDGGEQVEFTEEAAPVAPAPVPEELHPTIRYEDEYLLVLEKPAGLVVHPGAGRPVGTLVDVLAGKLAGGEPGRPGIVQRLDRNTSGLMVVARSEDAHKRLSAMVRKRALDRGYTALVKGQPRSRTGRIEAAIGRDRGDPTRISLETDTPREAATRFTVVELWPEHALLDVRLETGRMHQIRVHLAAIDLPVVGDDVYGVPEPALGRQFLHASSLAFAHPFSGEALAIQSELPPDLAAYLATLPALD